MHLGLFNIIFNPHLDKKKYVQSFKPYIDNKIKCFYTNILHFNGMQLNIFLKSIVYL